MGASLLAVAKSIYYKEKTGDIHSKQVFIILRNNNSSEIVVIILSLGNDFYS